MHVWTHLKPESKGVTGQGVYADGMAEHDGHVGQLLDKLEELGISENTIVIYSSDNGAEAFTWPDGGTTPFAGEKGTTWEGGFRAPCVIRWPGVIEANSAAGDIIHVSDLFTTFARVANATKHIPRDRVIDGVDQTALLLKGENHGRRDYVYIYENEILRSIVKDEFKMHMPVPGVPGAAAPAYNLYRDPREEHPQVGIALWAGASFQDLAMRHMMTIVKYPHFKLGKGRPYEGIENLRPETKEIAALFDSWQPKNTLEETQ